jgi:hypothetical protein
LMRGINRSTAHCCTGLTRSSTTQRRPSCDTTTQYLL